MRAEVRGLQSLRSKLKRLGEAEADALNREIKRAVVNIEATAKGRAPVDTGRLRNSLAHEIRRKAKAGSADEGASAAVGTNVSYAPYVEFGTRHQRARPYLFPALEDERPKFIERLRRAIDNANRKVSRS